MVTRDPCEETSPARATPNGIEQTQPRPPLRPYQTPARQALALASITQAGGPGVTDGGIFS